MTDSVAHQTTHVGCAYCGREPLYMEGKCHDCFRRVMMRFTTGCELPPCTLDGCTVCSREHLDELR